MKLTGVGVTKDMHPLGKDFLHLLAPTPLRFLTVCCFFLPHLSSTLVSPRDILKRSKDWHNRFSGQYMKTYFGANCDPNFGRWTFTCHSNLRRSKTNSVDGVVMNVICYTYPLILPEVSI